MHEHEVCCVNSRVCDFYDPKFECKNDLKCGCWNVQFSELSDTILEIRNILYGDGEAEPNRDACAQLTQEFFKDDTFRLLIIAIPSFNLGVIN